MAALDLERLFAGRSRFNRAVDISSTSAAARGITLPFALHLSV